MSPALIGVLMPVNNERRSSLGLNQSLEALVFQFGDQLTGSATAKQLGRFSSSRTRDGYSPLFRSGEVPKLASQTGPLITSQFI